MYQGQKILLIDDDPAIQDIYSTVLKNAGYNFSIAASGTDGIALAKTEKPSLILLDIMLPDLSGIDVLTKLRQDPATASATVWMLTNLGNVEIQNRAKNLGADDFLAKEQNTPRQVAQKINRFFNPENNVPI